MDKIELTPEELDFRKKIRDIYNSGRVREAYELAAAYYAQRPGSLLAKYLCAGMAGDYADDVSLPAPEKAELLALARKLIKEVCDDESLRRYDFYDHARNEYLWFYQLHEEQYALGVERVKSGVPRGYYSMCVGAASAAKKCLLEKNDRAAAAMWAERAVAAFHEFEKLHPDWYNINYFYADALAVLGKYPEAEAAFKDQYRKQKAPINEQETAAFLARLDQINKKNEAVGANRCLNAQ